MERGAMSVRLHPFPWLLMQFGCVSIFSAPFLEARESSVSESSLTSLIVNSEKAAFSITYELYHLWVRFFHFSVYSNLDLDLLFPTLVCTVISIIK